MTLETLVSIVQHPAKRENICEKPRGFVVTNATLIGKQVLPC